MTTTSTVKEYLTTRPEDVKSYANLEKAEQVEFCKEIRHILTNKSYQAVVDSLINTYKEALIYNKLDKGEFSPQDFRSRILALRDLNQLMLTFAANVKEQK